MPTRRVLAPCLVALLALTGCATSSTASAPTADAVVVRPSPTEETAAERQVQTWLDAAALPPGAVTSPAASAEFLSYTGWVCSPMAQREAFWSIAGATVTETANWLMTHPPADLVTTAIGPWPDDPAVDGVTVGYIPADGSYQGLVYTVARNDDGVGVRAEVAAIEAGATCPTPQGGGAWGPPGQG
jgi:hypothetical protein